MKVTLLLAIACIFYITPCVRAQEKVKKEPQEETKEEKERKAMEEKYNAQLKKDDKIIQEYLTKNNIKAIKLASGLYYTITEEGAGNNPKGGDSVTVNYTGKTIDERVFDSNTDPAFGHVKPFTFRLGRRQVIPGWDEGVQYIKPGGKGTLYIPSGLAYGEHSPTAIIPANSIMMFDVEVLDVKTPVLDLTGYTKLPSGLEYKIIKHGWGKEKLGLGDIVQTNFAVHIGDTALFDSRSIHDGERLPMTIRPARFKGDFINETYMYFTAGDSALIIYPVDSDLAHREKPMLPSEVAGKGMWVQAEVSFDSVKQAAEVKKENDYRDSIQTAYDDVIMQKYFKKRGLKPEKTSTGLYYIIKSPGTGKYPDTGQKVTIDYTAKKLRDEQTFLSNTDPKFNHVGPFSFIVGKGQVWPGVDQAVRYLKVGGKGTFYVPSALGYGGVSPGEDVPANSILFFEIELKDISAPDAPGATRPSTPINLNQNVPHKVKMN